MLLHALSFHLLILQFFLMQVWKAVGAQIKWQKLEIDRISQKINPLELQAALLCLKAFCKKKTRVHVFLKLNNTTDVAYINKKGGSVSASSNKLAKDIWNFAIEQDIWITTSHVPGVKILRLNTDHVFFYNNKEWSLNQRVAKSLFDQFEKPEKDLFASRLNTQYTKYASYKPELDAHHINTFSLCWSDVNSYIFSPFSIVGGVLVKIALVIVPCWQTQPWFSQFVQLVKSCTIDTSPSTRAPATRNKLRTPNLGSARSGSSNFIGHLSPEVTQIISAS